MMSLFPIAILTLYQQDHLGLSVTQIMFVPALFGLTLAVFEFPSGYLADWIGYRLSLILDRSPRAARPFAHSVVSTCSAARRRRG